MEIYLVGGAVRDALLDYPVSEHDWVVVGGARPFYEPFFGLNTPGLQGWGASSAMLGCLLGAFISGVLSDKFGRKKTLVAVFQEWGEGPVYKTVAKRMALRLAVSVFPSRHDTLT